MFYVFSIIYKQMLWSIKLFPNFKISPTTSTQTALNNNKYWDAIQKRKTNNRTYFRFRTKMCYNNVREDGLLYWTMDSTHKNYVPTLKTDFQLNN